MIISLSHSSKSIGLVFDDKLSFMNYITYITKSYKCHLIRIKKILINSIVPSRLDYCSSLLNVLPAKAIAPLNRVTRSSKRTTYYVNYVYNP